MTSSSIGIYRNTPVTGQFLQANPAMASMFGYKSVQELLAVPVLSLYFESAQRERFVREIEGAGFVKGKELRLRKKDGTPVWASISATVHYDAAGRAEWMDGVVEDVTSRRKMQEDLRKSHEFLDKIINTMRDPVVVEDDQHRFVLLNDAFCALAGLGREKLLGGTVRDWLAPADAARILGRNEAILRTGQDATHEECVSELAGSSRTQLIKQSVYIDPAGKRFLVAVIRDMTESQHLEAELRMSQKLGAVGSLAAGIAHEINTPTQYVGDNIRFMQNAFVDLLPLLQAWHELLPLLEAGPVDAARLSQLHDMQAKSDLPFITAEIPEAIRQSLDGVERIAQIVRAMRHMAHPDRGEKAAADINRLVQSTTTVSRNEWKYVADLELILDPTLPPVPCLAGELSQVILNLVVNAAHTIAEKLGENSPDKGKITITTQYLDPWVEVRISDTGLGIPVHVQQKIFEPFFTTKPVGKGTGQGLSLSRSVIWQLEVAAVLSQIGCVALSRDMVEKVYAGQQLSLTEEQDFAAHPGISEKLLAAIPRLEIIAQIVGRQLAACAPDLSVLLEKARLHKAAPQDMVAIGGNVLRIAFDFDRAVTLGMSPQRAMENLQQRPDIYCPQIVASLATVDLAPPAMRLELLTIDRLNAMMIIDQDVYASNGTLIVAKGLELTFPAIQHLRHWDRRAGVVQPVRTLVPNEMAMASTAGNA